MGAIVYPESDFAQRACRAGTYHFANDIARFELSLWDMIALTADGSQFRESHAYLYAHLNQRIESGQIPSTLRKQIGSVVSSLIELRRFRATLLSNDSPVETYFYVHSFRTSHYQAAYAVPDGTMFYDLGDSDICYFPEPCGRLLEPPIELTFVELVFDCSQYAYQRYPLRWPEFPDVLETIQADLSLSFFENL